MQLPFFIQCSLLHNDPHTASTTNCSVGTFCWTTVFLKAWWVGLGRQWGWPWIHPGPDTPCLCPSRQWALCKNYSYTFSLNAGAFSSKSDLFHCSLPQHREAAWKIIGSPECVNNIAFTEAYKRQANNDVVPLNFSLKSKNSKSRQTPGLRMTNIFIAN